MKTQIPRILLALATLLMCFSTVGAQTIPTLPCCIDFDDPDTPGYNISGSAVKNLGILYPGPSGDPADGYLHAKDGSGASWARVKPKLDGTPNCFGDWKSLIKPGKCIELCWDVNLLTDGDNSQVIQKPAHIVIWFGTQRATFRTFSNIDENGGWYSFCAPIALANSDGTLPSNADGEWIMNDANGDPQGPDAWNTLLCNIDQIAFFVDYHSSISEAWCWDNICLQEGPCDDCMEVSKGSWDCEIDATGARVLKYSFDVTNNSDKTAQVALVPTPVGYTIEPNTFDFDPDLAPGDTGNVTLCIEGAAAGSEICFDFVLFNYDEGECCREEICVKVPCLKIHNEVVICDTTGGADYTFDITNISGGPAEWAYLVSDDQGVAFSPSMVNLGGLADGATMSVGPIGIDGATAGEELCFYVVVLDEQLQECCIQKHCATMPDQCAFVSANPDDGNGKQVHPCEPNTPMSHLSPDGCMLVCDESIECDPENIGCVIYSFTVTNLGSSTMSHILFPHPDITPGSVIFPDPLDPGEAARVTVKIANQPEGPFTVPMTLVSVADCTCCHFMLEVTIPKCDCLQVSAEKLECEGLDPENSGFYCYTYCATITNLTGDNVEHIFLFPQTGSNVSFTPDHIPTGGLPHLGTFTVVSTVKIPITATDIHFHISLHNSDFVECCAVERWMNVPECCDCEETLKFEGFNGELPVSISLLNLVRDPDTGKIGFSPDGSVDPFPFVYMAASKRGTAVRIDANTGVVLGEFWTAPQTRSSTSPSRTTVDKYGECWVGNRDDFYGPNNEGSVMRIGLITGGTRGDRSGPAGGPYIFTPNPAGEYLQGPFTYVSPSVTDRDGDGLIRTSNGLTNILDWDAALSTGNDAGGVNLAADECIVNFVRVPDNGPRGLGIDSNNDLWVGGVLTSTYQQVLGVSGTLGVTHTIPGGYGALIDGNDVLWSVERGVGVHRHDLAANTTTFTSVPQAYGIGINPCDGYIWISAFDLHRIDPAGTVVGTWPQPGFAQGLSVDRNNNVWLSGGQLYRFDGVGTWLPSVAVSSTGNAVDHNGKIWVSNGGGDSADRVDPVPAAFVDNVTSLGSLAAPYNYSDMTGYVTLGAAGQTGFMLFTHDSICPGTEWGRVTWATVGEEGDDCRIVTEVRASDDPLNFPATWTPVNSGVSFCAQQGTPGIVGQYIQVRLTFTRPGGCPPECDPQLCWLKVECCDIFDVGPGNAVPVIEIGPPIVIANPTVAHDPISANVTDDSAVLTATWFVNGQAVSTERVGVDGNVTLDYAFQDGISEVTLQVSDGGNVASASTTAMVGDHLPPVINCDHPEFTNGNKRVNAFEAQIPDLRGFSTATDNVTPSAQMQIIQSPPAGTIVDQGSHQILLTATDAAGNVGHCALYLMVEQVVKVTGINNYQTFDVNDSISISANYLVPLAQVAQTVITINGQIFRTYNGPMTETIDLALNEGEYRIIYIVTSTGGAISTVIDRTIRVGSPGQAFGVDIVLEIRLVDSDNAVASFIAPQGVQCRLQHSASLGESAWETVLTVEGQNQLVEHEIDLTSDASEGFYRVQYPLP
jgi:hypothetical protein